MLDVWSIKIVSNIIWLWNNIKNICDNRFVKSFIVFLSSCFFVFKNNIIFKFLYYM